MADFKSRVENVQMNVEQPVTPKSKKPAETTRVMSPGLRPFRMTAAESLSKTPAAVSLDIADRIEPTWLW